MLNNTMQAWEGLAAGLVPENMRGGGGEQLYEPADDDAQADDEQVPKRVCTDSRAGGFRPIIGARHKVFCVKNERGYESIINDSDAALVKDKICDSVQIRYMREKDFTNDIDNERFASENPVAAAAAREKRKGLSMKKAWDMTMWRIAIFECFCFELFPSLTEGSGDDTVDSYTGYLAKCRSLWTGPNGEKLNFRIPPTLLVLTFMKVMWSPVGEDIVIDGEA